MWVKGGSVEAMKRRSGRADDAVGSRFRPSARLSHLILGCALLVSLSLLVVTSSPAAEVGLYIERLDRPNVIECPYCHKAIVAGGIHESAERTLATEFGGSLTEKGIIFTQEKGQTRYLHVFVYRFQERQGGNFSVIRPASAGFHTHLFEGGTLLQTIVFDETQQPLSENVLRLFTFIRRGGKWITVGELAREGVQKSVDRFAEVLVEEGGKKE
jgi:hypothetical protein